MSTHIKISTITVGGGGAASIDFTSIPATYTDLKLVVSLRSTSTNQTCSIQFNGDTTATNYSHREVYGTGTGVVSGNANNDYIAGFMATISTDTASTFSNGEMYIPNYTSANYKSTSVDTVGENNAASALADLRAGLWSSTAAINRIYLTVYGGNFVEFSSATLYGIKSS